HVILNPLILPATSLSPKVTSQWVDQPALSVPNAPEIETEDWIILNPPVSLFTFHMDEVRVESHLYKPKSIQPIASGLSGFHILRNDEYTLTIRPDAGYFASEFERLLRGDVDNLPVGYQVAVNLFTATVLSLTSDSRPLEIRFQFTKTLEDPSLRFLQWKGNKLAPFPLPAIGESVSLEPVRMF
ncbi:hypothetical protein K8I31_21210, partial [bacterium]|nr:hypothetical protein [bacterium]